MRARSQLFVELSVLAVLYATPAVVHADASELTPCQGRWEGMGKDPWLSDPAYPIELDIMDGARQCATVTYVGQCTARWVDCTVVGRWVHATEELVDPGSCAIGRVTLRCMDPTTLELKWEGEPGVMEATLHRVAEQRGPQRQVMEPAGRPETPTPTTPANERQEVPRGCGCSLAFVVIPVLGRRRPK